MNNEPNITFTSCDESIEVMRIDKHGVRANPEIAVDDAARMVLAALDRHIKRLVQEAVQAEREACAKLCDERADADGWEGGYADECAQVIRARSKE